MLKSRKFVGYVCPFVPAELIAGCGLEPVRLVPGESAGAAAFPHEGVCPYVRSFLAAVIDSSNLDAVITTTTCDQMRRCSEWLATARPDLRIFTLHVPRTRTPASERFFADELESLASSLLDLSGMQSFFLLPRPSEPTGQHVLIAGSGIRLAITGGPLRSQDHALMDALRVLGAELVLDATTGGHRTMPGFLSAGPTDDPFRALARAYLDISEPCERPSARFIESVRKLTAESQAQALIVRKYVWCDIWHQAFLRLRAVLSIPVAAIDVHDDAPFDAHAISRLQALVETLRAR